MDISKPIDTQETDEPSEEIIVAVDEKKDYTLIIVIGASAFLIICIIVFLFNYKKRVPSEIKPHMI